MQNFGHIRSRAVTCCSRKTPAKHSEAVFYEDNKKSNNNNKKKKNNNNNNNNNNDRKHQESIRKSYTVTEIQKICMLRSARILRKMFSV